MDIFLVEKITDKLPSCCLNTNLLSHLIDLPLGDDTFDRPSKIDGVIGAELFPLLLGQIKVEGPPHSPVALETSLGFAVTGPAIYSYPEVAKHFCIILDPSLESLVRMLWEFEEIPSKPFQSSHDVCDLVRILNAKYTSDFLLSSNSLYRPFKTKNSIWRPLDNLPNTTGIVPVPRGSKGPRSLYLRRYGDSFGFTLRHFIVYPPDSIAEHDGRHAAVGALLSPMDTIFVKHVKDRSPAKQAGLQRGDRLLAVNGAPVKDQSYSQVVQLILNSPEYLHLLVVPKEEDVLQRFFAETAYNPVSNKPVYPEIPSDRQTAQQILTQRINQRPPEFQVDAISWRSLQQPYAHGEFTGLQRTTYDRGQRSADNILYSEPRPRSNQVNQQEIYAEIHPHEIGYRQKSRAAPQVPLYKKMGRRASEGSMLSDREQFEPPDYYSVNSDTDDYNNMKAMYKSNYLSETSQNSDMPGLNYSNTAGCRLSLDVGRRESTGSLSSSIADGSKDSLASFDSTSTLTGHETDDSAIMNRFRRSVRQKEEFLRMPNDSMEQALVRREFYGRPKKLERQMWPPNEPVRQESPSRTTKPIHQNFLRVKNDIEIERDLAAQNQNGHQLVSGNAAYAAPQQRMASSPKDRAAATHLDRVYEGSTAPSGFDNLETINGSTVMDDSFYADDRRMYSPGLQIVHKRAKDFESGRPLPEDDPIPGNRMNFSRSELARLSSKKLVPNVTERALEYEIRAVEPRRDNSGVSTNSGNSMLRRIQRDSRSLDSSGSNASSSSINELLGSKRLSGNVTISSGSKYIHCPPPSEYGKQPTDTSGNEAIKVRARSNSAESWVAALGGDRNQEGAKRISRQDAVVADRNKAKEIDTAMDVAAHPSYADLSPLIPEPVEHIHLTPAVSITPAPSSINHNHSKAVRPTQLDLEGPIRPVRHLKPPSANVDTPARRSISPTMDDKPVVVKRRPKNTNIAEDERAMRRESYLKATEGGRMHIDSDLSDGGDISPQVLRSAHRRWRPPMFPGDIQQLRKLFEDAASSLGGSASSSSASLDREKASSSPSPLDKEKYSIIREGTVHCKILEIDGKRAADRSWKQVFIVLKGPKLFIYKDRHHQSPIGTSDALDHSLASGVDMRTSVVRVAEDYTKRKNVLRVSSVKPCRSEFLLQAESTEEFADWVKILQEQVAASTDAELDPVNSKQQAVPQMVPALTTIQVQGSHLSPQLNKAKTTSSRNRSPTGQSPVSKTRKPTQISDPSTSPKSKTWRGRMAKQFRKFNQGGNSPSSPTAPEGSTFGIPIEECLPSTSNMHVPRFVEVCTDIIDERGLQTVGIYRVPGNNASITALTEEINRNYDEVPLEDPRWNDLHVVSSLLKSYFRKMPDSLVTVHLYPNFIKADKIEDPKLRLEELRRLVRNLPKYNYHTLKHIIMHLKRVADNSQVNRMEAKNLAIVFGPTIVRPEGENMESMVNHMNNQCKIVESLLTHADWFFPENDDEEAPVPLALPDCNEEFESANNQALLLHNISKYEVLKDQKEKNGALFSSIISAAQRKVKRKPTKGSSSLPESKDEPTSPTNLKVFPSQSFSPLDLKECTSPDGKLSGEIPTTVMDIEKKNKPTEKVPWFNYSTDKDEFHRRIQNFRQETEAMLQLPRKTEISVNNIESRPVAQLSSSASNVNHQNVRLSMKPADLHLLTKTHSASNVFARTVNTDNSRNSLSSMDNNTFTVQYNNKNISDKNSDLSNSSFQYPSANNRKQFSDMSDPNKNVNVSASGAFNKGGYSDTTDGASDRRNIRYNIRRGSSVENLNSSSMDLSNGNLKKVKYENENENQRTGSLDSLNKLPNDDESLLSTMTKLIDEKLKEEHSQPTIMAGEDIPFADESPEKRPIKNLYSDKENIPRTSDLYRNPSLHKSQFSTSSKLYKREDMLYKESKKDKEKEEDTMALENVPDNDRHISPNNKLTLVSNTNKLNQNATGSKLKRSESLNKPERTVSPLNSKLKRSESLNKTGDKLKRSDSLTKNEKTESNINKRREISISNRRGKDSTKNKRKNGMPDRSIKRRHTVGGTKDPDKVTWLLDNKNQEENNVEENGKEKNLRTSSPDLSSTRRDRFFFEINLIGPENMVVALRQHLIGARPQSFPESTVFKVPLESHV